MRTCLQLIPGFRKFVCRLNRESDQNPRGFSNMLPQKRRVNQKPELFLISDIFQSTHKVRAYECDFYGHVNNSIYLNYLEFARMEVLETLDLSLRKLKEQGVALVIQRIDISYKFPAVLDDILQIRTNVKSHTNTVCTFRQEIFRAADEKLLAAADVTWVCTNLQGRPIRIPQIMRDALGFPPRGGKK